MEDTIMSATILQFPKDKIVRTLNLSDEDKTRISNKQKKEFVEFVLNELTRDLYESLEDFEFNVNDPNLVKDLSFTIDTVRSAIYRSLDLKHPLQDFIDGAVNLVDDINNEDNENGTNRENIC